MALCQSASRHSRFVRSKKNGLLALEDGGTTACRSVGNNSGEKEEGEKEDGEKEEGEKEEGEKTEHL